jgi:hypothetical protein
MTGWHRKLYNSKYMGKYNNNVTAKPDRVKPKTIQLVFSSLLSTQHWGVRAKSA